MEGLRHTKQAQALAPSITRRASWEWNLTTNKRQWNNALYRIYGVDNTFKVPSLKKYFSLIHPDDRKMVMDAMRHTIDNKSNYDVKYRILTKDKLTLKFIHSRGIVTNNQSQQSIFIGSSEDITELIISKKLKLRVKYA